MLQVLISQASLQFGITAYLDLYFLKNLKTYWLKIDIVFFQRLSSECPLSKLILTTNLLPYLTILKLLSFMEIKLVVLTDTINFCYILILQ